MLGDVDAQSVGGPEAAERWPIRSDLGVFPLLGAAAVAMAVLSIPIISVLLVAAGFWNGLCMCFCGKLPKKSRCRGG